GQAETGKRTDQDLGPGFGRHQAIDDDHVFGLQLCRKGMAKGKRANLLRQVVGMAADDRAVGATTATELRGTSGMVTGAAGTLLLVHLLAGARDLGPRLGLVGALLLLGELIADHADDDVFARVETENLVRHGKL